MAEVTLLVLGAALGYFAGWLRNTLEERRRRKAAATALNAEYFRLRSTLEYLSIRWKGGKAYAEFATPMHDRIPEFVTLFEALAVARMLDFTGFLFELREGLRYLNSVEHPEQRKRLVNDARELTASVLEKGDLMRESLLDAGAIELPFGKISGLDPSPVEEQRHGSRGISF